MNNNKSTRRPLKPSVMRAINGLQSVLEKNAEVLRKNPRIVNAARTLHKELVASVSIDKCVL